LFEDTALLKFNLQSKTYKITIKVDKEGTNLEVLKNYG